MSWQCTVCTFHNENPSFLTCEMCGEVKPPIAQEASADTALDGQNLRPTDDDDVTKESSSLTELQQDETQRLREKMVEQDRQAIMEARMQEIIQMQQEIWQEETGKSKLPTIINTPQNSIQDISMATDSQGQVKSNLEDIRREQLKLQEQRLRQQQERLELERLRLQLQQKEIEIQRQSQMGMSSYSSQISGVTEASLKFSEVELRDSSSVPSIQFSSQQFDLMKRKFGEHKQESSLDTINDSSSNVHTPDSKLLAVRQEYDRLKQRQMELNRARPGVTAVSNQNDDPSRAGKINQLKNEYNQLQARQEEIRRRSMAVSTSDSQSAASRPGAMAASNDPPSGSSDSYRQMRAQQKVLQAQHVSRKQGSPMVVGVPLPSHHLEGDPISFRQPPGDPNALKDQNIVKPSVSRLLPGAVRAPPALSEDSVTLRQMREQQKALQGNREENGYAKTLSQRPGAVSASPTDSSSLRELREQQKALQANGSTATARLPIPEAVSSNNESDSLRQMREQQKAMQKGDVRHKDANNPTRSRPGAVSVTGIRDTENESTSLRELREQQKSLQGIPVNNSICSVVALREERSSVGFDPDEKTLQDLPGSKGQSTHSNSVESFALDSSSDIHPSDLEGDVIHSSGPDEASLRQIREEQRALRLARTSNSLQISSRDASLDSSQGSETKPPTATLQQLREQQKLLVATRSDSNGSQNHGDKQSNSISSIKKSDSSEIPPKLGAVFVEVGASDESETLRSLREQQKALLEKGRQDTSIASESPEVQAAKLRQMRMHQKALHQTISQQAPPQRSREPPHTSTTPSATSDLSGHSARIQIQELNSRTTSTTSSTNALSHQEPAPPVPSRRSSQISRDLQAFQKGRSHETTDRAGVTKKTCDPNGSLTSGTGQSKRSLFNIGLRKKSQKEKDGQSNTPLQKKSLKNLFSSPTASNGSTMNSATRDQRKTQKSPKGVSPTTSEAMHVEIDRMMDQSEDLWAKVEKK